MNLRQASAGLRATLLGQTTIAAAISPALVTPAIVIGNAWYLLAQAIFLYGSGGTTVDAYLQTTIDGTTWIDIANFHLTTVAATKGAAIVATTALAANPTLTDGSLAANTILSGLIGSAVRLKYQSSGTYAGATSLQVDLVAKA